MSKKILIGSGILMVLTFFAGPILHDQFHSPLADFIKFLCFPFFTLIFLLTLFLVRVRRSTVSPGMKNSIRVLRVAALLILLGLSIAVCWPRQYGSLPMEKRSDIQYWDLPTGSKIAYTLIPAKGIKKRYPIICLHGGPGGAIGERDIRFLTPISEDGYDVYVYDQIGGGWSDRLPDISDYTADRHKRDLEAIVQKIGAEKVVLIGHSWGAILATLFAADNPSKVAAMILTGPGPIQPAKPGLDQVPAPDSLHLRKPFYSNRQGNEEANNMRTRAMAWVAVQWGKKLASDKEADDFAAYQGSLVDRSTVSDTSLIPKLPGHVGGGFYAGEMTAHSFHKLPDPRPKLRNSAIPLLVLKGQYDNQPWGAASEYLEIFPHHKLVVIPDAGHSISVTQPQRLLREIMDFLKNEN